MTHELLQIALSAAVPLRMAEYAGRGGPTGYDIDRVRSYAVVIAEGADNLMFRGGVKGKAADLFNRLADALAVMAFLPGGVSFAGEHWEFKREGGA